MKAKKSETRGTRLKQMNDYQPGKQVTGIEILSDFESLLCRVARFSSAGYRGTKNLGFRLKYSIVREGHLFIFIFL